MEQNLEQQHRAIHSRVKKIREQAHSCESVEEKPYFNIPLQKIEKLHQNSSEEDSSIKAFAQALVTGTEPTELPPFLETLRQKDPLELVSGLLAFYTKNKLK